MVFGDLMIVIQRWIIIILVGPRIAIQKKIKNKKINNNKKN